MPAGPPARLLNPANPAARLMLATPEQRQKALENLSPQQQERIRRQLAWFDALPKPQQQLQIQRLHRFAALTPDQRMAVRRQIQAFNQLPPERKAMVRRVWQALESLPPRKRAARLSSEAFKTRFTPEEQQIVTGLADAWLPPL